MQPKVGLVLRILFAILVLSAGNSLVQAQSTCGRECNCPNLPVVERSYSHGRFFFVETTNFRICCDHSQKRAQHLARHAEALKNALSKKWLARVESQPWNPRCLIVLHETQRSYVAAVGLGSERTVGSSLVNVEGNVITSRRIDLLDANTEFLSAALPHELTHVVLKERFKAKSLPRWADEGVATLADSAAKLGRHRQDLYTAIANSTTFPAIAIMTMEAYPPPDRFGVFYGQSVSLAEYLVKKNGPHRFVEFMEEASNRGYDSALQQCYEIANTGELDRQWRSSLKRDRLDPGTGG